MTRLGTIFRTLNTLSLDVAAGSMCSTLFFAGIVQVKLRIAAVLALGFSVWIIYTADHLLDARKITGVASTHRHRFHQQHFTTLVWLVGIAMVADAVLLAFVREQILWGGLVLGPVVAVYLLIQRFVRLLKEFFIAAVYTCGVLLPPWVVSVEREPPWAIVIPFFLTALLNLLMYSRFDWKNDTADGAVSFATITGTRVTEHCAAIVFVVICVWVLLFGGAYSITVGLMAILQILPLVFRQFFEKNDRYRMLGDAAFMIPGLYLLF